MDQVEADDDLKRRDGREAQKEEEALELLRVVAHHVDDLSSTGTPPAGVANSQRFVVEHGADGGLDEHSCVDHDDVVPGLSEGDQTGDASKCCNEHPRVREGDVDHVVGGYGFEVLD